jgi:hypothetical protein
MQQFSVCDYQLLSGKENSSHEAQEVQVHQAPEDTARRGAKHRRCKCIRRQRIQRAVVPGHKATAPQRKKIRHS